MTGLHLNECKNRPVTVLFCFVQLQYQDLFFHFIIINIIIIIFLQLSSKRETCGDKSRQLRDAQQDARDKVEVKNSTLHKNAHIWYLSENK